MLGATFATIFLGLSPPGYGGLAFVGIATGGLFATATFRSFDDSFLNFLQPGFGTNEVELRAESGLAFAEVY